MEGVTISPPLLGGGTWGCHTLRNKASTWVWCLQTPPTDTAQLQGHTHARTGPRAALPGGHTRGDTGGRRRWGVKALAWQWAEPPRAGAPWAVAEGRSRHALSHRLLPRDTAGGHGGRQGPRGATSPLQRISPRVPRAAKRTEKCLEKRETPRKPAAATSPTSPPCPERLWRSGVTPQRKRGPGPAGVGGTEGTQARPIPALYTKA